MEVLLIVLVGLILAAPARRGGRELPASRAPIDGQPRRRPRGAPAREVRRLRLGDRVEATHDRRCAFLVAELDRAVSAGDPLGERRFLALLRAEGVRHAEKVRRLSD